MQTHHSPDAQPSQPSLSSQPSQAAQDSRRAAPLLLIDDEPSLRTLLAQILRLEGFFVLTAASAVEGLALLESEEVAVVITDVKLPDRSGIEVLQLVKEKSPDTEVVLMTAYGNVPDSVKAIKLGAFDYITKGDDDDAIILTIEKAAEKAALRRQLKALQHRVESKSAFTAIIGKSKAISETIELAKKVSATETTVLLLGETGTGKELFAEAIHNASRRRERPFVAINCSAIPKDLQESELFGYKKGAFTGAVKDKRGYFEEAQSGTIFLDEVGDMSLETQAKLLRVLETKSLTRVGDTKPVTLDVRVIAATHRDLDGDAEHGRFREDLFYRLNGFTIYLPPLREREDDIEVLARHFLALYAHKLQKKVSGMENDFRLTLRHAPWKGNIRELKNVLERAVILSSSEFLTLDLLPDYLRADHTAHPDSHPDARDTAHLDAHIETNPELTLNEIEKIHIKRVLELTHGNKVQTAKKLGIGTATLYRKLKEYEL